MHLPVLTKEVIKWLNVKPNRNYVDATIGQGGHAKLILEKNAPDGRVLGMEWDSEICKKLRKILQNQERLKVVNESYVFLKQVIEKNHFRPVHGILFDLGMSSWHLEESGRGFSFQKDEPLDMRYDINQNAECKMQNENSKLKIFNDTLTASKIVNNWSQQDIKKILKNYGEEKFAERIAKNIIQERQRNAIKTTRQLVQIIKQATPSWYHRNRIHPATRTFQALRIAVNAELENLKTALPQAADVLEKKGRLVVISFHSLEDKIVKGLKSQNMPLKALTKKPIRPSSKEVAHNPRARSARLRAFEKI